jgi:hypothetical protein
VRPPCHRGHPGNDPKPAAALPSELRDDLVAKPSREVVFAPSPRERQHGEPETGWRARRGAPPVPAARHGLDERRLPRSIADDAAEALDGRIEAVVEIDVGPRRPELAPQLLPRHHGARPGQQQAENPARLLLQPGPGTVALELAGRHVQHEGTVREKTASVHVDTCPTKLQRISYAVNRDIVCIQCGSPI